MNSNYGMKSKWNKSFIKQNLSARLFISQNHITRVLVTVLIWKGNDTIRAN